VQVTLHHNEGDGEQPATGRRLRDAVRDTVRAAVVEHERAERRTRNARAVQRLEARKQSLQRMQRSTPPRRGSDFARWLDLELRRLDASAATLATVDRALDGLDGLPDAELVERLHGIAAREAPEAHAEFRRRRARREIDHGARRRVGVSRRPAARGRERRERRHIARASSSSDSGDGSSDEPGEARPHDRRWRRTPTALLSTVRHRRRGDR
jgi:hypothetical protein